MNQRNKDLDGILILRESDGSLSSRVAFYDARTQEAVNGSGRSIFYFIGLDGVNGHRSELTREVSEIIDDFNSRAYSQDEATYRLDQIKLRYSQTKNSA